MPASVLDLIIRSRKQGKGAKEAETGLNKLKKAAQLAAVAGFAVLTAAAIKFLKSSIDISSQMEEMRSKFDVVFGQEAPRAAAAVEELANRVGRSRLELTRMAASLQDTFVPMGLTRNAAADLSLQLTELAVDVGSFNDVATGDVARDFQSALVGNTETVRKYGIVITEANTKQKAYELGIAELGAELTDQEKLLTRVQQIIAGTADAQGDAVRTADSLANSQRRLAANSERLGIIIGDELNPSLADLAGGLSDSLEGFFEMSDAMDLTGASQVGLLGTMFKLRDGTRLTRDEVIKLAQDMRSGFERIDATAIDGWREATERSAAAADDLGSAIGGAAQEVPALEGQFASARSELERSKTASDDLWESLDTGILNTIDRFQEQIDFLQAGGPQVVSAFNDVQEALQTALITPEEAEIALKDVELAAIAVATEAGQIDMTEAVRQVRDEYNVSWEDAKKLIQDAAKTIDAIPLITERRIDFFITYSGAPLPPGEGGKHGLDFIVPPGFNQDDFPIGVSSGERVKVTPTNQVTNNNNEFGRGMTVNVFGQDDETIFLEKLRRAAGKL